MTNTTEPLLSVDGLTVSYGGIRAVRQLSIRVNQGEIVAVLGANGAGKSSTMNALMGLAPAWSPGIITLAGTDISRLTPERITKLGMTLTPEGRRVFAALTIEENLRLGAISLGGRAKASELRDSAFDRFPVLSKRRHQLAGTLSGGEQQQLAIARSLMSSPRLLLLDEPSLGLAPVIVDSIFDLIKNLRDEGTTILVVEQNVDQALSIADRGYVLAGGELQMEGRAADLRESSGIERAYLGMGAF